MKKVDFLLITGENDWKRSESRLAALTMEIPECNFVCVLFRGGEILNVCTHCLCRKAPVDRKNMLINAAVAFLLVRAASHDLSYGPLCLMTVMYIRQLECQERLW